MRRLPSSRALHRGLGLFAASFLIYLGTTGTLIQLVDLRSLATHASAFDPNVRAMREGFDGPSSYQVIATSDYVADPLPENADLQAMFARVLSASRRDLGEAPFKWIEVRMLAGRPVGQVVLGGSLRRFDAASGADLGPAPLMPDEGRPPLSQRNLLKNLHRMTSFGDWALWLNIAVALSLIVLVATGALVYGPMFVGRLRMGRPAMFWMAGGWWRSLHRAIALLAFLFLAVVSLSGSWLALESLGRAINAQHQPAAGAISGAPDGSEPLQDGRLPAMLRTTLRAYHRDNPGGGERVVRLRWYAGAPQGALVTAEPVARQLVYNAATGAHASASDRGAPASLFPFGWTAHQIAKHIHRGDIIGVPGQIMDLLAGLSVIYLGVSGMVMYANLLVRRRKAGRQGLIWG